jgi:hypothetical protein
VFCFYRPTENLPVQASLWSLDVVFFGSGAELSGSFWHFVYIVDPAVDALTRQLA